MDVRGKTIAVTGATGNQGGATARYLLADFAALAFADPGRYLGQAIEITGDRLTAPQIADALSAAAGRPIPHTQIPLETLREHAPRSGQGLHLGQRALLRYRPDPATPRPPRPHGLHRLAQPNRPGPPPGPAGIHAGLTGFPERRPQPACGGYAPSCPSPP
jgi:uncharacterized protein YbjT (DUF2867 family)